jgi:hypothetical protein
MTARVARCDYCGDWFPVAAATANVSASRRRHEKEP